MTLEELKNENIEYLNMLQDKDLEIKELKDRNKHLTSYIKELEDEVRLLRWDISCLEDDLDRMVNCY